MVVLLWVDRTASVSCWGNCDDVVRFLVSFYTNSERQPFPYRFKRTDLEEVLEEVSRTMVIAISVFFQEKPSQVEFENINQGHGYTYKMR